MQIQNGRALQKCSLEPFRNRHSETSLNQMQCLSDHLGERHGAKVCAYTHFLICRTICYQSGDLPYFCDMRDLRTKETERPAVYRSVVRTTARIVTHYSPLFKTRA